MSKRKPVVNLMEALKKSLDHLHREKPMTPEDTPRMTERTDRQEEPRVSDPVRELCELLEEAGATVQFGLRAQGHIPTIERMLADDRSWKAIGKEIGWDPLTAAEWYVRELVAARSADAALLRERDAQIASLDAHIERQNTFIGILDKRIVDSGVAQEALGSKLVMAESVAKNNYDACERARAERDAAQQENKTLREALERVKALVQGVSPVKALSAAADVWGIACNALSSSPRPQEPQP